MISINLAKQNLKNKLKSTNYAKEKALISKIIMTTADYLTISNTIIVTVAYKIIVELNELKHFQNQFLLLFLKNKKINLLKRYFFVAIRKSLRHTDSV
ncbi:MAG: hypothetical protein PV354_05745 [Bartonella sp.]|nr:hypothetical protein [Bartonella sp.]